MPPATALTVTPSAPATAVVGVGAAPFSVQPDGALVNATASTPGSATGATFTGLAPDTPHTVKRKATDSAGNVRWSNPLTVNTLPFIPWLDAIAAYNALAATGGNGGATLYALGTPESQVVVDDGSVSTGKRGTSWPAINRPGEGFEYRPGTDAVVATAYGSALSRGYYIPATSPLLTGLTVSPDPTVAPDPEYTIDYPSALLNDRSRGLTLGVVAKAVVGTDILRLGEAGASSSLPLSGNIISHYPALNDSRLGMLAKALTPEAGGSDVMVIERKAVATAFAFAPVVAPYQAGRSLPLDVDGFDTIANGGFDNIPATVDTNQHLYLLDSATHPLDGANHSSEVYVWYLLQGRPNRAQTAYWNDVIAINLAQWASVWEDTRDLCIQGPGDSFDRNLTLYTDPTETPTPRSYLAQIVEGSDGAAEIPNTTIVGVARSGNFMALILGPLWNFVDDCDFSHRAKLAEDGFEAINTSTLTQNEIIWDKTRAYPGTQTSMGAANQLYFNGAQRDGRMPGANTDLQAAVAARGGVFLDFLRTPFYRPGAFADGVAAHMNPVMCDQNHMSRIAYKAVVPKRRIGLRKQLGLSVVGMSYRIEPSAEELHLDVSIGETGSVSWTAYDYDGNVLAGKTFTFSVLDPSIATVDPTTGVVTALSAGNTALICSDGEGGVDMATIFCTGSTPPPPVPAFADYDFSSAGNLFQDSARTVPVTAAGDPIGSGSDISGNNRHATQPTNGQRGTFNANALLLDGTGQHLLIPDADMPTGPFTVISVAEQNDSGVLRFILTKDSDETEFIIQLHSANYFIGQAKIGGATESAFQSGISSGYHVFLAIYDGANISVSVDGGALHSTAASGAVGYNGSGVAAIGAGRNSSGTLDSPFNGHIKRIKIWHEALTGASLHSYLQEAGDMVGITIP